MEKLVAIYLKYPEIRTVSREGLQAESVNFDLRFPSFLESRKAEEDISGEQERAKEMIGICLTPNIQ